MIGALVNVLPKVHGKLLKLHQDGNSKEAMELQGKLGHADWAMQKLGGISGVKSVISKNFGYGVPNVRGPLKPLAMEALVGNKHAETVEELIALEKSL